MAHTLVQKLGTPNFLSSRRSYYCAYTVCFVVFAIVCFAGLYAYGNCLIWEDDGVDQHFSFFCYFGTWIREAISSGVLPQWEFSLGYGADIICSLASWIGDPFNWFSVLCPEKYSEYLYQFLVIVRLYLVGFAFSAYCRYHKRDGFATLIGAIAFAFCGFCLLKGAFRHAMFINPAFLLPWVLLGADKVLDRKQPTTLIIALAVTFASYFYFAYMIVIFLVLYCLLRYFVGGAGTDNGKRSALGFAKLVGRFLLYGITGALIAGVLLAPIVAYVIQMGRISVEHHFPIARYIWTYLNFPVVLAGGSSSERGLAMEALAVFGIAMLLGAPYFRQRTHAGGNSAGKQSTGGGKARHAAGKQLASSDGTSDSTEKQLAGGSETCYAALPPLNALRQTRIALIVMFVFILIPFFGRVFNGFSYNTDRWMFALAMCISYALTLTIPFILDLEKRDWRGIGIVLAIFAADALLMLTYSYNKLWIIIALACLALTFAGLFFAWKRSNPATLRVIVMALLLVNVGQFANCSLFTHEAEGEDTTLADYLMPFGTVLDEEKDNPAARMLADIDDDSQPYRYDKATEVHRRNSTVMQNQDLYSVDFYASIYSQAVDDFRDDLGIAQSTGMPSHLIYTSNSRAALEAVSSVKYFLRGESDSSVKPYGFDALAATDKTPDKTYELWKTNNTLPFAFTYDKVIPLADFEAADPLRRQEALLQGCAVEGSSLPETKIQDTAVEAPFTVDTEASDGAYMDDEGNIVCTKKDGKLVLNLEGAPNSETYVYFENLDCTKYLPGQLPNEEQRASMNPIERFTLFIEEHADNYTDFLIRFRNNKMSTTTRYATPYGKYYTGRKTWLVNTGYTEKACNKLTLTFEETGTVTFKDMKVLCQPMDDFTDQVAARAADETHVELSTNAITGTVDAPDKRLVYCAVPYSQGWSATVDGQPVTVLKANTGFMAIEVSAGHHEFAFTYETPFLKLGIALTIVGLAFLCTIFVYHQRRRRKEAAAEKDESSAKQDSPESAAK